MRAPHCRSALRPVTTKTVDPKATLEEQCAFAGNRLDRASERRSDGEWLARQRSRPDARALVLLRGDPLIAPGGDVVWMPLDRFDQETPLVFLGLDGDAPRYAADISQMADGEGEAPFNDYGVYAPLRDAAAQLDVDSLSIIGHGRWLLDWHRRHQFCARCGGRTELVDGGAKRRCTVCGAEHFPRSDPVAIVVATHDDACLLGRSPRFPPKLYSALAGFVEPAETPEECARREVFEEAGVRLGRVEYCFSQPWPFPSSLMMGFLAEAESRALKLDETEITEAVWLERKDVRAFLSEGAELPIFLPPRFTIARRLIERWALGA